MTKQTQIQTDHDLLIEIHTIVKKIGPCAKNTAWITILKTLTVFNTLTVIGLAFQALMKIGAK